MAEKTFQKHDWKFKIGLVLIIFWSIIIGILNIGILYLFGIPILGLLIGIIFIWFAKETLKTKFLMTFLPIPITISVMFLISWLTKPATEIFLIPANYQGEIVIFYNESCGQPPIYEDGKHIYQLSENGVLITQSKKNSSRLNQEFFLVDTKGNRIKIPFFHWQNFETETKNWSYFNSTPVEEFTKESVGVFWSYGSKTYEISSNSLSFIVSNFRYNDKNQKERWNEGKSFAMKAKNLLNQCQQNK